MNGLPKGIANYVKCLTLISDGLTNALGYISDENISVKDRQDGISNFHFYVGELSSTVAALILLINGGQ